MVSFRVIAKKHTQRQLRTLDSIHSLMENKFIRKRFSIRNLELQLENEYKKDNIKEVRRIQREISDVSTCKEELDYYLLTSDILFEYYSIIESTKCIGKTTKRSVCKDHVNRVLTELETMNRSKTIKRLRPRIKKKEKPIASESVSRFIDFGSIDTKRKDLYSLYTDLIGVGDKELKPVTIRMCCSKEMVLVKSEGYYICRQCGIVESVITEYDGPIAKTNTQEKSGYPYKRINHLNEWIAQFQAKETTEIPDEVYKKVKEEIERARIKDLGIGKVKTILKKLQMSNYYEHIPHIISKISKAPPPTINREQEEKIRSMFKQMQEPFEKHRPVGRTNFLNYSYVLHKICQLTELDDILESFPLLKSRDKLRLQDGIWAKICKDCNWKFYPSV